MVAGGALTQGTLRQNANSNNARSEKTAWWLPAQTAAESKTTPFTPVTRKPLPIAAGLHAEDPLLPVSQLLPGVSQAQMDKAEQHGRPSRGRVAFAAQILHLQEQAAARNATPPPLSEHPAFRGMNVPTSGVADNDYTGAEDSTVSNSDTLYIHSWTETTTPATSSNTTPEKNQQQAPAQVRRKPVPAPPQVPVQAQAKVTFQAQPPPPSQTADPIAVAASRAAALRIKRKTIPRPISIVAPLSSERAYNRPKLTGTASNSAQPTPLRSAAQVPWSAKYGPALRTPRTGSSLGLRSAFGNGWKQRYADLPTPVIGKSPSPGASYGPPSDFEYARQMYGKFKEYRYEKKRAAAIDSAREPKTPKTPKTGAMPLSAKLKRFDSPAVSRFQLNRTESAKNGKVKTPGSARFFGGKLPWTPRTPKEPKTPKTPKTPKSSGFRRPSFLQSRSRSNSTKIHGGATTPRTPFTPSELSNKVGAVLTQVTHRAVTAATSTASVYGAVATAIEAQQAEERRARMKAAISKPNNEGRVFAADAFDPIVVRKREEEMRTATGEVPTLILGIGADGEKRQTTIGEFIEAGMGRHPLLQQAQAQPQPQQRLQTPFQRQKAHSANLSISSAVSAGTSSGKAKNTKAKTSDQKPTLMSKINDFSSNHLHLTRRPSVESMMSFVCAGVENQDEADMQAARQQSRCRVCGNTTFGLGSDLCEACARGVDGYLGIDSPWPQRDASLPHQSVMPTHTKALQQYRSSSVYSPRMPLPVFARSDSDYSDPGNPFDQSAIERKRTLDPRGSSGLWDSDSWLDTESEKQAKQAGQAEVQKHGTYVRAQVGRDTEFYRFYDDLLVSPSAGILGKPF